ncbi:MAG: hypothetical protein L0H93_01855 [Nocardioides sp.]|nr:hypothetical protein [Nocardioides sp.]
MSGPRPGPEDFAETIPEIVAQLRKDPVLVEDIMSNGHTAEVKKALDAKAAEAAVPVYVVLTRTPSSLRADNVDEELVSLLHARLDEDGVYFVATSEGQGQLGVWGDFDSASDIDATLFQDAQWQALSQIREAIEQPKHYDGRIDPANVAEAGVVLDIAADRSLDDSVRPLTEQQVDFYNNQTWTEHPVNFERVEPPDVELAAIVATAVGLTMGVVAYRLLRAWAAWRSGDRRPGPDTSTTAAEDLERLRSRVDSSLALIDRRMKRIDVPLDRVDLARNSRDTALRLRDSEEALDVVGALVLARTGAHAISAKGAKLYRCCYVNPLHGEGRHTAEIGAGLDVPACADCRDSLAAGRTPDALIEVRPLARDQPFYVGDSGWARTASARSRTSCGPLSRRLDDERTATWRHPLDPRRRHRWHGRLGCRRGTLRVAPPPDHLRPGPVAASSRHPRAEGDRRDPRGRGLRVSRRPRHGRPGRGTEDREGGRGQSPAGPRHRVGPQHPGRRLAPGR